MHKTTYGSIAKYQGFKKKMIQTRYTKKEPYTWVMLQVDGCKLLSRTNNSLSNSFKWFYLVVV